MKQNLFNLFSKRLFILIGFLSVGLHVNAETEAKNTLSRYVVEVDSQFIKATPYEITYENNEEIHHDENVEWYNDMTVYRFLPKEIDENGVTMESPSLKPTIFLLSGGAFVTLDNQTELNPANNKLHDNIKLASKLANEGYNVFWINYQLETNAIYKLLINFLLLDLGSECNVTDSTQAKARMEHASLKSFRDFRVKFKNIINNPNNHVDPDNVFVSGISAGAILTIYSVFLDQSEIPESISYINCKEKSSTIVTIGANHSLRKDGYPMPAIRGIIPMAGGSLYNTIFNNTSHSNNVAVNLMHGTCDEIINQEQGRVGYKLAASSSPLVVTPNTYTANRYPHVYGSKYIFNTLKSNHTKIGFGQVIKGGHAIITLKSDAENQQSGAWDILDVSEYSNPPPIPDMNLDMNPRDIVFDNISTFMKRVMGETGYPAWDNHAYSVFPDMPTTLCLADDQTLINPPISTSDTICTNLNNVATLIDAPSWTNKTWTVSSNLQIIGSNTGDSIIYKGLSLGTGTITVTIGNYGSEPVVISKTVEVVSNIALPSPTVITPDYDFICGANKTLTLSIPYPYHNITWSSNGNIGIVSQNGSSVTYKRINNSAGSGELKASIGTSCATKTYSYIISTYQSGFSGHPIGIISDCETGLVTISPTKLVPHSTVTFTSLFANAENYGIVGGEWNFSCGVIVDGPTHFWIGTSLRSQITVQVSGSAYPCGDVRVRPIFKCGVSPWKIQKTEKGPCSGGGWSLLVYPNPSSNNLVLTLDNNDEKLLTQQYPIEIVDVRGNTVMRSVINNGKSQLEIGHLLSGHYKIIVRTDNEIITESFIIKK